MDQARASAEYMRGQHRLALHADINMYLSNITASSAFLALEVISIADGGAILPTGRC